MKLAEKVAIITGAGAGIGEATARLFAEGGARLCLNSLSDSAGKVAESINAGGGRAIFVRGDVSSEEDARRIVEDTVKEFGGIDVFFNNAGMKGPGTSAGMGERG